MYCAAELVQDSRDHGSDWALIYAIPQFEIKLGDQFKLEWMKNVKILAFG